MKQRKILSMIGALVVMIGAAALFTGCPQANGGNDAPEIAAIEFDTATIECKKGPYPYTKIKRGDFVKKNDELRFEAILSPGKTVENWYINDVKQPHETSPTMYYTVKAADIVGGKLKVSVVIKDTDKIEFDTATVKCKKGLISDTEIKSGDPIQENDELRFEAILPPGKTVENWYINDVKQPHETSPTMYYTVKAADIVGGKLKVSVVIKDTDKIEFDTAT
ncbi:MAG: hypothetical protein ACTTH7_02490, partial [Treponema sp.]